MHRLTDRCRETFAQVTARTYSSQTYFGSVAAAAISGLKTPHTFKIVTG